MRNKRYQDKHQKADRKLLALTFILVGLGLIAVADASAPQALANFSDKFYFFKQQALWAAFGIAVMLIVSRVNYRFWERLATPLFWASAVLLAVVLIPGVGTKVLGARRWLIFGPISIQPSEIIKLTLAIYLAKVASSNNKLLALFLPLIVVAAFIMLQPDLGTTLVVVVMAMSQIFVSGINPLYFFGATLVGTLASFLLIITSSYRRERLLTFLERSSDPLGSDYHIRQVLLALGSGGLFGVGLGQSRQKFLFLPEAATDSIFAIIAEEVGFIGALFIIILFAYFIFKGLTIAKNAPDRFAFILALGLTVWIGGQAFLNIASMVALTPLTGIPLPFFSYGGSALVMVLVATGILLGISREVHGK